MDKTAETQVWQSLDKKEKRPIIVLCKTVLFKTISNGKGEVENEAGSIRYAAVDAVCDKAV